MKDDQIHIPQRDRVRLIRIHEFFKNSAGNALSFLVGGVLFVLILRSAGAPDASLLAWFALLILASGALALFQRYVNRVGLSPDNADRLYRIRTLLGGATCALYGATVVLLSDQPAGIAHTFAFIAASTVVTVSYMAYATMFSYCLTVNAVTLLPFTVFYLYRYFTSSDTFFLLMGLTAIAWQIIIIAKALLASRSAVGAITLNERLRDEMAERRLIAEALKISEDQSQRLASMLRLMCDNVPDMIWAKDLENRYLFANKALCEQLLNATSTEEPVGKTFDFFVQREREQHPDDPQWLTYGQYSQDTDRHTIGRDEPTSFEESGRVCGRFVTLDVHQARFINSRGVVIGTVGCARDITERKASEALVQHLAHHDVLTDLPNRALLSDRLRQALAQARRDHGKLAVLFLDLDNLKPVNDTLGHAVGDLILKEVARRLREVVTRQSDTVSRLGGDEFVILIQRVNSEQDASVVADKILDTLSQPFSIDQLAIDISASIGIAIFPEHGEDVDLLLRNADAAMYCAKHEGRNCSRFFDASMAHADGNQESP